MSNLVFFVGSGVVIGIGTALLLHGRSWIGAAFIVIGILLAIRVDR